MKFNVIFAIFRRNLYSYFSSPTGYVFICVYVLLSSFAAFWPNDFFNSNLANLDQLNKYLPYILLVFIPAITMSIWADERRQGTDELLLTIPAGDLEVVLGKYLAAVAIFSVSLVFSLVCNLGMLARLGNPDIGLFLGTYLGYWFVGLAMLAIGMVASFLTGNLTVGFVLGALFNAPLAFAASAEVILPPDIARTVKGWSLEEQFRDFGRGVVSLSSIVYFTSIVLVMLYLSMVLIGRRHWLGGRDGKSLGGHYFVRSLALVAAAVGAVLVAHRYDARLDVTSERLSSLSPETKELMRDLNAKHPVKIDAFVSSNVPESYVQTRLNLLSTLREFEALGGANVQVTIHNTDPLSPEAERAEERFGITGRQVISRARGAQKLDEIFLGVAFTSGLNKVVVPFIDRGIPVEYEVARSICTVTDQKRKRLGVLSTDAKLFGSFDPQTMTPTRDEPIIDELKKQYEVVQVSADAPITEQYAVLLAVQPSSLSQEQMNNFVAAVRNGQPTAIFEDPFPYMAQGVPATSQEKQPPGGMMGMMGRQPPTPKGDVTALWDLLGVRFSPKNIVWQKYNPYTRTRDIWPDEFVCVDSEQGDSDPFNESDAVTSRLQQLLFLFPGSISPLNASRLKFEKLVTLEGKPRGTVSYDELLEPSFFGRGGGLKRNPNRIRSDDRYVLAARIRGKAPPQAPNSLDAATALPADPGQCALDDDPAAPDAKSKKTADGKSPDAKAGAEKSADHKVADNKPGDKAAGKSDADESASKKKAAAKKPKSRDIDVILVSDIDLMYSQFFQLRAFGQDPDQEINFNFDNVSFVLNVLDALAGDDRSLKFIEIRKRRPQHRTLTTIDERTQQARDDNSKKRQDFKADFDAAKAKEEAALEDELKKLGKGKNTVALDMETLQKLDIAETNGQKRLQATVDQLQKKYDKEKTKIDRDLTLETQRVQDQYKMWAVLLPPILPMLVGLGVYFNRRAKEREGVARSRLR
jgi:ABC-type transport system involved in multi-copper enzyme maturation permease subunit